MFRNMIMGLYFPVLWALALVYAPDVYYLHTILRWTAVTLMISYLVIVPMQAPFYNFKRFIRMKITLRVWVVVGLFAVIWGHIPTLLGALIMVTAVACSTILTTQQYRGKF